MSDEFLSLPDVSGYYSCSKDMSNKTPIDFFEFFEFFEFQFTDDIADLTNLYADQISKRKRTE